MGWKMKEGLYTRDQLGNDQYHASEPVSSSGLKRILQSPAHFKYPAANTVTRAKDIGSAIHCAVLETDRFMADYRVVDCEDRRSAIYKAACKDRDGSYVLTQAEGDNIQGMQEGIMRNRSCRELIEMPGDYELSLVVKDPVTGVLVKVRYDKLCRMNAIPVDLKKTQSAKPSDFQRAIINYDYHLSAALYQDAWEWLHGETLQPMRWIACEEKSPHAAMRYKIDEEALMVGRALYRDALNIYAECLDKGEWPAYGDDEEEMGIPGWAISQFEESLEVNFDEGE
jgi:hypothetical protein